MKILVVGCNGQLGHDMLQRAQREGHDSSGTDYPDVDIADQSSVEAMLARHEPRVVINCAAYTAVDNCEREPQKAFEVNDTGVANLARAAVSANARVVHISTDYVFDGTKVEPYTEEDEPNPRTVYGRSKLAGEQNLAQICPNHQTFRIAWLYGAHGANFAKSIVKHARRLGSQGSPLRVVGDQRGTPTCTLDVCRQVLAMIESDTTGLFHCTAEGACSWYDFARLIVSGCGIDVEVIPCTTEEFPRPAPRPANSVLANNRLNGLGRNLMPQWEEGFTNFLKTEGKATVCGET